MLLFRLVETAFSDALHVIVTILWLFIFVKVVQGVLFVIRNRGRY